MANPNPEIWGNSETWEYSKNAYGLETETAINANAYKPKSNNFGTIILPDYEQTLYSGVLHGQIEYNSPLDRSICPCGQAPDVSPFAHIAVFNENNDLSETPSSVHVLSEHPVNWFFCDRKGSNNSEYFSRTYNYNDDSGLAYEQFSPKGATVNPQKNPNLRIAPYTQYGIKSLVLGIQVHCVLKTATQSITGTFWTNLDDWKNNYSDTYNICGLRLFVRNCTNISSGTLTYNNDNTIPAGQCAGEIGVITDFDAMNNGETTNTEFLTLFMETGLSERCCYIFDRTNTVYNWNDYRDNRAVLSCWDYFDEQTVKQTKPIPADPECYYWYSIPYSENNYNKIMAITALFGCYFTPTGKYSFNDTMTDVDLCLPVLDDNGIAHGEYTRGLDNANNSLYDKSSIRDIDYDPDTPIDPNVYSDTTSWNTVNFINAFTKRYILNASQVGQLSTELWSAQSSKPENIDYQNFAVDEYLTNNPIDTIVSLKYFPCTFEEQAPTIVYLGKYATNIAGAIGLGTSVRVIDFDPIPIYPHFGDFRDFEPYTQLTMYIPFCGTVSIPTAECMGNYVSVKLCIDVGTGAASGYVIVSKSVTGGICVATATGTAAIDIPVSGLQSANLSQAIFNAAANWTQTQISNFKVSSGLFSKIADLTGNKTLQNLSRGYASTLKGNVPTTLGGLVNTSLSLDPINAIAAGKSLEIENAKADYNLTHIELPMRLIGSISPALSSVIESNCRLIIYRPITDERALSHYADTVGFATVQSGIVSQFTGYTEGTIDVSGINATAEEKTAIANAFASGVYL